MKQRDPSVLHETFEAVEGVFSADEAQRVSCDEASKSKPRGGGGPWVPWPGAQKIATKLGTQALGICCTYQLWISKANF